MIAKASLGRVRNATSKVRSGLTSNSCAQGPDSSLIAFVVGKRVEADHEVPTGCTVSHPGDPLLSDPCSDNFV